MRDAGRVRLPVKRHVPRCGYGGIKRALARLVLDPALASVSGRYFEGLNEIRSSEESYHEAKAASLWEQSAELVGLSHDTPV